LKIFTIFNPRIRNADHFTDAGAQLPFPAAFTALPVQKASTAENRRCKPGRIVPNPDPDFAPARQRFAYITI
jgi:hypothetical protein